MGRVGWGDIKYHPFSIELKDYKDSFLFLLTQPSPAGEGLRSGSS